MHTITLACLHTPAGRTEYMKKAIIDYEELLIDLLYSGVHEI